MGILRRAAGLRACILLLLPLLLAGCSMMGRGGAQGSGRGTTTLVIENNVIPPITVTVYLVPEVGGRQLLGVVGPGATRAIRFDPVAGVGQFRFLADPAGGASITSNPVSFTRGETVRWDLNSNLAIVQS